MTGMLPPMCIDCARRLETTPEGEFTCEAYPAGIPDEIVEGEWDHRFPKRGDRGLLFVMRDGSEARGWWPDESGAAKREEGEEESGDGC